MADPERVKSGRPHIATRLEESSPSDDGRVVGTVHVSARRAHLVPGFDASIASLIREAPTRKPEGYSKLALDVAASTVHTNMGVAALVLFEISGYDTRMYPQGDAPREQVIGKAVRAVNHLFATAENTLGVIAAAAADDGSGDKLTELASLAVGQD